MELNEHQKAELKSFHDHRLETYKSMISFSTEGFKFSALLNGGAAAGMVATIDKLRLAMEIGLLRLAMVCFVTGLVTNGAAIAFAYATQMAIFNESVENLRPGFHNWPLALSGSLFLVSLLCFCCGAIAAVQGLKF